MRIAGVVVLMAASFAAGWWLRAERGPSTATAAPVAVDQARIHDCRDDCEQRAILQKRSDEWLQGCRMMCGPMREPIRSITRAPNVPAAPPAVKPR